MKRIRIWLGMLLCLWCLAGITLGAGPCILYDDSWGDTYSRVLKQADSTIQLKPQSQGLVSALNDKSVRAVELYDVQAQVLARNTQRPLYWYPHYKMNIVLAVDDACKLPVTGWHSLLDQQVTVGINLQQPFFTYSLIAFSYGLNQDKSGQTALRALQQLYRQGRLRTDTLSTPASYLHIQERQHAEVYILPDFAVRMLQQQGQKVHLVVPQEGTLTFTKGLAAYQPLQLNDDQIRQQLGKYGYSQEEAARAIHISADDFVDQSASLLRLMRRDVFQVYRLNTLLPVSLIQLYLLLIVVILFLGLYICRCMLQQPARRACLFVVLVLLFGVLVRLSSLLTHQDTLVRWLWYSYYIFFALLITGIVWLCDAADRELAQEDQPRWLKWLAAYNLALGILVLGNDYHQWAFVFPQGFQAADVLHDYGPLYYLILLSYAAEFFIANIRLYYSSWRQKILRPNLIWPLLCIGVFAIYLIGYIYQVSLMWYSELIMTTIVATLLWLGFLVQARILPANVGYKNFFTYSNLALEIQNESGRTVFRARNVDKMRTAGDIEKKVMPITGGVVVWYRNIHELAQLRRELNRTTRVVSRVYRWLRQDEAIRRQLIDKMVSQEIYRELERVIQYKRQGIQNCLRRLRQAGTTVEKEQNVRNLNILACYIKKRCVLLLRGRETQAIPANELQLALRESLKYFTQAGLCGSLDFQLQGSLPVHVALWLYDCLEECGEMAVRRGEPYWLCSLKEEETAYRLSLVLENMAGHTYGQLPPFLAAVQTRQESLEYGCRLSFLVGKEQNHG